MNLVEVMIASLIVVASSAGSLQVWTQMMQSIRQQDQLQRVSDQLDADLVSIEGNLRRLRLSLANPPFCGQSAPVLQGLLASSSQTSGIVREVSVVPADDVVQVVLSAEGHPWKRQRQFRPAALGLCSLPQPEAQSPSGFSNPG